MASKRPAENAADGESPPKESRTVASSDDEAPVAIPALSSSLQALLESDDDIGDEPGDDGKEEAADSDAESDSSSSSGSSSSSSSGSSSSSESEAEEEELKPEEQKELQELEKEQAHLVAQQQLGIDQPLALIEDVTGKKPEEKNPRDVVNAAQLRRDEIFKFLEVGEERVIGAMVRLTLQDTCIIAEVVGIEPSVPYTVSLQSGPQVPTKVQLRCCRGDSVRLFKITHVSNSGITDREVEQWLKFTNRCKVGAPERLKKLEEKARQITETHNFAWTEAEASKRLRNKQTLEFLPQQESRMQALLQCTLTQMDISGIRDNDSKELEQRYKNLNENLIVVQGTAARLQDQWFDKRANVYSLKEINRKNFFRQQNRDRHALDYTYQLEREATANTAANPFERRACRPVCAWDTSLTKIAELETKEKAPIEDAAPQQAAQPAAPAKDAKPAEAAAKEAGVAAEATPARKLTAAEEHHARVQKMLKAHRILGAGLGLLTPVAPVK